jgi:hypothetical protein
VPQIWPAVALALASGCATSIRFAVAPTLDTEGHYGGQITLGFALGTSYRKGQAALLLAGESTGAVGARPAFAGERGPSGHVAFGFGADALGESRHFGFRIGAFLDGRVPLPNDGRLGGAVGGRFALLPVVAYHHGGRPPTRCGEAETFRYWHLGVEATGAWLWGPDARGLFSVGPVVELDALDNALCD